MGTEVGNALKKLCLIGLTRPFFIEGVLARGVERGLISWALQEGLGKLPFKQKCIIWNYFGDPWNDGFHSVKHLTVLMIENGANLWGNTIAVRTSLTYRIVLRKYSFSHGKSMTLCRCVFFQYCFIWRLLLLQTRCMPCSTTL